MFLDAFAQRPGRFPALNRDKGLDMDPVWDPVLID